MNEFKDNNFDSEPIIPKKENQINPEYSESEKNKNQDNKNENNESHPTLEDRLEVLNQVEEIRKEILQTDDIDEKKEEYKKDNKVEVEIINGQEYKVIYVPKEEIYPAYGYGGGHRAIVREDLPPRVKKFVKAHELYHCTDKSKWGGWIGSELRANLIPGLKDPLGLILTTWKTITDKDRIKFYLDRIKRSY